ncbi:MAG: glycosyltransferase [Eubacterium sp.]|nr:glycosyltransferase [Eubacterium sp.]
MKIIVLDRPAFGKQDIIEAFHALGIETTLYIHDDIQEAVSETLEEDFANFAFGGEYDFVFSFNYFPSLSRAAKKAGLKYVSFVYDSPLLALFSCTIIEPHNYVFIFDSAMYQRLADIGIPTVYYLPLCSNPDRNLHLTISDAARKAFTSDISFVGSLYNEEHNLLDRIRDMEPFTKGYLDSLMEAQMQVSGVNFVEDCLSKNILDEFQKKSPYLTQPGGTEPDSYIYANYFVNRKITSIERIRLLSAISEKYPLKIFSKANSSTIPKAAFPGTVDYYEQMPLVFQCSKINLNITLRSIINGIPLRAFDIMGNGGFLLTNFQSDLLNYFVPNEDFVYFESKDDLLTKVDYYLTHEKERKEIAANGLARVKADHTYVHRAKLILEVVMGESS